MGLKNTPVELLRRERGEVIKREGSNLGSLLLALHRTFKASILTKLPFENERLYLGIAEAAVKKNLEAPSRSANSNFMPWSTLATASIS